MAKNTTTSDNEIDLIELIQVIITHKAKFIILGIVGLSLGLAYTLQHEPTFRTDFKVIIGHPAFSNDFLINSAKVREILNTSELNKNRVPSYSFDKKTQLFKVTTSIDDASQVVSDLFTSALKEEIRILQMVTASFKGLDTTQIIRDKHDLSTMSWTNQDIAKLNPEQLVQSLIINYSKPKVLYPKPLKHGVIGIFIGLVLALLWMMADILVRELKKK